MGSFSEKGRLGLDLDDYARGAKDTEGKGKWGRYIWRSMVQPACPVLQRTECLECNFVKLCVNSLSFVTLVMHGIGYDAEQS